MQCPVRIRDVHSVHRTRSSRSRTRTRSRRDGAVSMCTCIWAKYAANAYSMSPYWSDVEIEHCSWFTINEQRLFSENVAVFVVSFSVSQIGTSYIIN